MKSFVKKTLIGFLFILGFTLVVENTFSTTAEASKRRPYEERISAVQSISFPGVVQVGVHMRFDKILGVIGGSDISYGDISPSKHERIVITPDGALSSENSNALSTNSKSHPGEITIHDGRAQQFNLVANRYTSSDFIRSCQIKM